MVDETPLASSEQSKLKIVLYVAMSALYKLLAPDLVRTSNDKNQIKGLKFSRRKICFLYCVLPSTVDGNKFSTFVGD